MPETTAWRSAALGSSAAPAAPCHYRVGGRPTSGLRSIASGITGSGGHVSKLGCPMLWAFSALRSGDVQSPLSAGNGLADDLQTLPADRPVLRHLTDVQLNRLEGRRVSALALVSRLLRISNDFLAGRADRRPGINVSDRVVGARTVAGELLRPRHSHPRHGVDRIAAVEAMVA